MIEEPSTWLFCHNTIGIKLPPFLQIGDLSNILPILSGTLEIFIGNVEFQRRAVLLKSSRTYIQFATLNLFLLFTITLQPQSIWLVSQFLCTFLFRLLWEIGRIHLLSCIWFCLVWKRIFIIETFMQMASHWNWFEILIFILIDSN